MAIDDKTRNQRVERARNPKTRRNNFSKKRPVDWSPQSVPDPRSFMKLPFTGAGAWHCIVELLEAGQDVGQIELDFPPGATGYVLVAPGAENNSEIYIKLELVGSTVHGRSFHISING